MKQQLVHNQTINQESVNYSLTSNSAMKLFVKMAFILGLAFCLVIVSAPTFAVSQTMRPSVFRMLEKAQLAIDQEKYVDAQAQLNKLSKMKRNSYEKAMTENINAYYYFSQDKYDDAIVSYQKVLKLKVPDSLKQTTLYSLAKLYMVEENYSKTIESIRKWQKITKKANSESHIILAQSYLQLSDDQVALEELKKGMQIAREEGRMIKENWYLLERAVYFRSKDYRALEKNLQELIAFYPKTQYWLQLSAVYDELNQAGHSLATLESAYDKGYLNKESELISFSSLLLQYGIPYKAAKIIDKGIKEEKIEGTEKHYSMLADAWMLAKENDKAIEVLKLAVGVSKSGEEAYKLAQIYMEKDEWDLSSNMIERALEKGKLRDKGNAYLIQGLSYFNQKKFDDATKSFTKAKNYEARMKAADQWLDYIKQEKARISYIESIS